MAGLFWLHQGENITGSDPQSDVVLPEGTPKRAGIMRFQNGGATWEPASGPHAAMKPDTPGPADVVHIGDIAMTVIKRGEKTGVRLRDPNAGSRRNFTGCRWFPVNDAWRVKAKWVAWHEPRKIAITNVLGMTDRELSPGYAEFVMAGRKFHLEPVTEDDHLFFHVQGSDQRKDDVRLGPLSLRGYARRRRRGPGLQQGRKSALRIHRLRYLPVTAKAECVAHSGRCGGNEISLMLILASRSPRRAELLSAARIPFTIRFADIDETPTSEDPTKYVLRIAENKARAVGSEPDEIVLAADTIVVLDGVILGKPSDAEHAARMLTALSGRRHEVITGICLRCQDRIVLDSVSTAVWLAALSEKDVWDYVASGEPMDKAGAYAIQGIASRYIDRIDGSYSNVVGLPVGLAYHHLRTFTDV